MGFVHEQWVLVIKREGCYMMGILEVCECGDGNAWLLHCVHGECDLRGK